MKKLFALLLAVIMTATLAVPAFAATAIDGNNATSAAGKDAGDYSIGVNGTYVSGSAADDVISVDISWGAMNFTYTDASQGTWNPETHGYIGATEGGWSTNKPGITVTNHSNVGIEAAFSFTAADGVTTKGSFYASAGEMTSMTELTAAEQKFSLATAVGTTTDNAPADTLYFGISGDPISENKSLGTITISIAKKTPKRTVGTEEELNAAIEALKTTGGTITLTSDLSYINGLVEGHNRAVFIPAGTGTPTTPLVIDFGGHEVGPGRFEIAGTETSRSYVTLKNGTINYFTSNTTSTSGRELYDDYSGHSQETASQAAVFAQYADLKLEDLTIHSQNYLALMISTGTKTLIEGDQFDINGSFYAATRSGVCCCSIYNTSTDEFVLHNTGLGTVSITNYIILATGSHILLKSTEGAYTYKILAKVDTDEEEMLTVLFDAQVTRGDLPLTIGSTFVHQIKCSHGNVTYAHISDWILNAGTITIIRRV